MVGEGNTVLFLSISFSANTLGYHYLFKDLNAHATPIIFKLYVYVFNVKFIKFIHLQGRSMLSFLLMNVVLTTVKMDKK